VIIDVEKFSAAEQPLWRELEGLLQRVESDPGFKMSLQQAQRLHYLYERASADLGKLVTFSSEPELRRYLESLVARAYSEIHETRTREARLRPFAWFMQTLPQTFRRHIKAFWLSVAITIVGCVFGGLAMALDPEAKPAVMPEMFSNHLGDPADRVREEETAKDDRYAGHRATFSAFLMQNNIACAIKALALGMTYGIGTIVLLFYNGVILGVVATDYVMAGQTKFLLGWLLPHGVIEIPAILIAGQTGLVLANALVGWGRRERLRVRLRAVAGDLTTLIFGVAIMLVWAGFVESFLSQYHQPVLPYWVKITFGCIELIVLIVFLARAGREKTSTEAAAHLAVPS
jgi:uncharacterized membrane protein SpoIIM required for sporulation